MLGCSEIDQSSLAALCSPEICPRVQQMSGHSLQRGPAVLACMATRVNLGTIVTL